jgi:hypothetical protein
MGNQHLASRHRTALRAVFQHPIAHNLEWRAVVGLLGALGSIEEHDDGKLAVEVNGEHLVLQRPKHKDVTDALEVLDIRHFLERAGVTRPKGDFLPAPPLQLLVIIDHHATRIYVVEPSDATPKRIEPYDPHGYQRHLVHRTEGHGTGQRAPEEPSYYEAVAKTLAGADAILVMGHGTGKSSAMNHLVTYLTTHHPETARKIAGAIRVDLEGRTDAQLLAEARTFLAS